MNFDDYLDEYLQQQKRIWAFIISAYLDAKASAEIEAFREHISTLIPNFDELRKTDLPKNLQTAVNAFIDAQYFTEKRNEYFALKEDDPDTPEIRESLKEVDLTEKQFATASFAATGKKICKMGDFFRSLKPKTEKEIMDAELIRKEGVEKAKEALKTYRNGDPGKFARMLADGLKVGCEVFSQVGAIGEALPWSFYAQEVLDIIDKDPKLLKSSGLNPMQLNTAREIAKLGSVIKQGLEAVEMVSKAAMNPEKQGLNMPLLQERIVAMHQASYDRSLIDVQKKWKALDERLFPDDLEDYVKPEKELPQKVLNQ